MVVKQVKQWIQTRASAARLRPIQDWAETRRAEFHLAREAQGFLIEQPQAKPGALRIEWGPAQRDYVEGMELRMRCELGLLPDLQLLAIDLPLMERLEAAVFEAYTDTLKTRVDTDTPEEMRWLVMFPKYSPPAGRGLRERFGLVGVHKELSQAWVEGEFGEALAAAGSKALAPGQPFVMLCTRGNLYLRTAMAEPDLDALQAWVRLLECGAREALKVSAKLGEHPPWATTTASAWPVSRPLDPSSL